MRFTGKTVVVTGSGKQRGLGQAILRRFAEEGANCVVSDLTIDAEAEAVGEDLRARKVRVATLACDVSDAASAPRSSRRASICSAASTFSSTTPASAS